MQVALLSANAQAGDAIGNQVAEKLRFFLDRGATVRVFLASDRRLHPAVRRHCQLLDAPPPTGQCWEFLRTADLIIVEYSQSYPLLELLPLLADGKSRILFDYHGVTPVELWSDHQREAVEQGQRQRGLVWCADAALVHSRFTAEELCGPTGFPEEWVACLGYPVDRAHFQPGRPRRSLRDQLGLSEATLLLFVGRLAPNKRVPLLVEALHELRDVAPPVHVVVIGDTTDVYALEAQRCRQRAAELGLADRLHLLGQVPEEQLLDAYRSADLLVMPSRHEGFCIPVIEALACGLPVLAASAGALPETVASAGLTFLPDDPIDLASQVRRLLSQRSVPAMWPGPSLRSHARSAGWVARPESAQGVAETITNSTTPYADSGRATQPATPIQATPRTGNLRVAVVAPRFGGDFVGGAETSLRTIATVLRDAGCTVTVFTTCARSDADWANRWPEGSMTCDGLTVHRFRVDAREPAEQQRAVQAVLHAEGVLSRAAEKRYLEQSVRSTGLVQALRQQIEQWDAVIVGPYLYGLAFDIATAFPAKTLLLPCFHDEVFARLQIWREAYREVGGILYHSPAEKAFAERTLGLNHPGGLCLGTWLETTALGNASRGRRLVGCDRPYLVYCGRYLREKNLPQLLDYAERYQQAHPGRFDFVFVGQGDVPIPPAPWAHDLGFVPEADKRDILAGAAALVQLSYNESLSLVALESWVQGVPVIASAKSTVLVDHLRCSRAGRAVADYAGFAAALDELWHAPESWRQQGERGRAYVQETYGSRESFLQRLLGGIEALTLPLFERLRQQGLLRAAEFERSAWRERFGGIIEELLDRPARPKRYQVEVHPRSAQRTAEVGSGSVLIPVRVVNQGTLAAVAEGPGRTVLRACLTDDRGQRRAGALAETPLPGLLLPGQEMSAAVRVAVPEVPGRYLVTFVADNHPEGDRGAAAQDEQPGPHAVLELLVEASGMSRKAGCCTAALETVQRTLVEAEAKRQLPTDYLDVTHGFLARWKRWLKRKLLGNFQHAYVDVLSRQQSAFNRQMLIVLQELAECCAVLDHVHAAPERAERGLGDQVRTLQRRLAELEARLTRMPERDDVKA